MNNIKNQKMINVNCSSAYFLRAYLDIKTQPFFSSKSDFFFPRVSSN